MSQSVGTVVAVSGIVVASTSIVAGLFLAARREQRSTPDSSTPASDMRLRLFTPAQRRSGCQIGYITGDIMQVQAADIWVNAENTDMEMARITENSISGLVRYWGAVRDQAGQVSDDVIAEALADAVGAERPVAAGTAFVTTSGGLREHNNVKHIIHVAAVQGEPGAGFRQVLNVSQCVVNALTAADELAAVDPTTTSILFPLLGAGNGRANAGETIRVLLEAALGYLDGHPETKLTAIYFLGYTDLEAQLLETALMDPAFFAPAG